MKNITLIFLMCFVLIGCGLNTTIVSGTNPCPAPKKPKYQQLDNATHIGSDKNLIFLMNDLNMIKLFIEQQNNTIECYREQVKTNK